MGSYALFYANTPLHGNRALAQRWHCRGYVPAPGCQPGLLRCLEIHRGFPGGKYRLFRRHTPLEGTETLGDRRKHWRNAIGEGHQHWGGGSAPGNYALFGSTSTSGPRPTPVGRKLWKTMALRPVRFWSRRSIPEVPVRIRRIFGWPAEPSFLWQPMRRRARNSGENDGTSAGTQLLLDINSGSGSSSPGNLTLMG